MKKTEKQSISNEMNLFTMLKSSFTPFCFIKPSSGLYGGEKLLLEQRWIVLSE